MNSFNISNPAFITAVKQSSYILNGLVLNLDASDRRSYDIGYGTTWKDISTIRNNCTLVGPTFTKTNLGGYMRFTPAKLDRVQVPYHPDLDPINGITFETLFWGVNVASSTYQEIYRKENGNRHLFSFQNAGKILSLGLTTSVTGYQELDVVTVAANYNGRWNHITATYRTGYKAIYRNGAVIGSTTGQTGTINRANATAYIGTNNAVNEFLNGYMVYFRMYNRSLDIGEIQHNYKIIKMTYGI